jgi:hypothetical protein
LCCKPVEAGGEPTPPPRSPASPPRSCNLAPRLRRRAGGAVAPTSPAPYPNAVPCCAQEVLAALEPPYHAAPVGGTLSSSRPRRPGPPCRRHGPRTSSFGPVDRAFTLARDSSQWPGRHQAATSYSGPRARAQGARWYGPTKPLSSTSPSTCSSNCLNQQH